MGERNKVRGYRQGATYFRFKRSRVVLDELIILTRKVSYLTWNVIGDGDEEIAGGENF